MQLVKKVDQLERQRVSCLVLKPLQRAKSLSVQTAEVLRDALEQGVFGSGLPGERKLCGLLRVSRPTLRAALEALEREGWIEVAQGKPSRVVRPRGSELVAGRRKLVVLTPVRVGEMPSFFRVVLEELRTRLEQVEMPVEVVVERGAFAGRPHRTLEGVVRSHADAIWLLHLSTEATQRWFFERAIPCVLAGTPVEGVLLPGVDRDNRGACRHAAATLLNAGRRVLALLLPEGVRGGDEESRLGFLEGVSGRLGELAPPRVVRHDTTVSGVCQALDRLLQQTPRTDGLLVGRASHALTALTHLLRSGHRVPADVSLIARDDDAFLAETVPAVARYVTKPGQFAGALVRRVERLCRGVGPGGAVRLLVPELERGASID